MDAQDGRSWCILLDVLVPMTNSSTNAPVEASSNPTPASKATQKKKEAAAKAMKPAFAITGK
jgi:hypothetical protein